MPVENSTEGAVGRTLDLMYTTELSICGEIKLRVQQNLLSNAPAIDRVVKIYSHAQSLAQCAQWLASHLPGAARIPVSSNAEAARLAAQEEGAAAIAGEIAASIYGLGVLAAHIEDEPNNTTRFWVLGPPGGAAVRPRRDIARDVGGESPRRHARAARAVCAARRVDVAYRVAAGTHRIVGVPVLRGRRSAIATIRRSAQRSPNFPARLRFSSCWARIPRIIRRPNLLRRCGSMRGSVGSDGEDPAHVKFTHKPATAIERAPEYVRAIAPYVGGKPIEEVARELDLDPATIIKLASNENPRGPSPKVARRDRCGGGRFDALSRRQRFRTEKRAFRAAGGRRRNRSCSATAATTCWSLTTQAFLRAGDHAVYSQYAFIVYPLATQARGALGIEVPAKDHAHDLDAMRAAITPRTRIVFIANPNNPTGTWLAGHAVEAFIASVPEDVIVVLDEAYNEFLDPSEQAHSTAWLARFPHLVISRTFSKAHGLAALRVGYGVMNAAVADLVNRVRQPFNVNSLAQAAAIAALDDTDYVEESRRLNREGMRQLEAGLAALSIRYVPSRGNFILIEVGDAMRVYQALLRQGVIVRPVANYDLPTSLRVTVGMPAENARFLAALAAALPTQPAGIARAHR